MRLLSSRGTSTKKKVRRSIYFSLAKLPYFLHNVKRQGRKNSNFALIWTLRNSIFAILVKSNIRHESHLHAAYYTYYAYPTHHFCVSSQAMRRVPWVNFMFTLQHQPPLHNQDYLYSLFLYTWLSPNKSKTHMIWLRVKPQQGQSIKDIIL